MALNLNFSTSTTSTTSTAPAAASPSASPSSAPTTSAAPPPPRSTAPSESFARVGGQARQGLNVGGPQPTLHAMLVPKSQFQTPTAANDNQRNYGTAEEKAAGIHVDEHGWMTLPPGSTITVPPKS